jgi:predicted ferric reductase
MPIFHILFKFPDSIVKNELIRVGFYIVLITFSIPLFWLTYKMLVSKDYLVLLTGAIAVLFNQLIRILASRNQWKFNLTHFDFSYWILCYQMLMGYVLLNLIG